MPIERLQRHQRSFPPNILLGINVLILTVALGTMRHEADLVTIYTPFLLILFLNAVRWNYSLCNSRRSTSAWFHQQQNLEPDTLHKEITTSRRRRCGDHSKTLSLTPKYTIIGLLIFILFGACPLLCGNGIQLRGSEAAAVLVVA